MNVYFETLGCRLNEAETQRWHRELRSLGHHIADDPAGAQLLVLNSCAVTADAVRTSRRALRRLRRASPGACLVVTGCAAALDPERFAADGADMLVGNEGKDDLVTRVRERLGFERPALEAAARDRPHTTRAFVKVQDGCRHRCTFCVVTIARGEERSRTAHDIVNEVRSLEAEGTLEVVLTGVHLGGYGRDLGTTLPGLVEVLIEKTTVPRLRLSSLEPWDLSADFFSLWQNPRLMPHLHLPIQSGSDRVLRRMGRRNSVQEILTIVDAARARVPALTLTTDLIVGFPGETEEDWRENLRTVQALGLGNAHVFPYSPRDGTAAARLDQRVERSVVRRRCEELARIVERARAAHLDRFTGTVRPVLWEAPRAGTWTGYTDNYLRVTLDEGACPPQWNTITNVQLTKRRERGLVGIPIAEPRSAFGSAITRARDARGSVPGSPPRS